MVNNPAWLGASNLALQGQPRPPLPGASAAGPHGRRRRHRRHPRPEAADSSPRALPSKWTAPNAPSARVKSTNNNKCACEARRHPETQTTPVVSLSENVHLDNERRGHVCLSTRGPNNMHHNTNNNHTPYTTIDRYTKGTEQQQTLQGDTFALLIYKHTLHNKQHGNCYWAQALTAALPNIHTTYNDHKRTKSAGFSFLISPFQMWWRHLTNTSKYFKKKRIIQAPSFI